LVIRTCRAELDKERNFLRVNFESLKKTVNEKTRILIIINPCNPTGYGWDKKDYE
jgi:aspartate/methionine/tyrosine aminotransferase